MSMKVAEELLLIGFSSDSSPRHLVTGATLELQGVHENSRVQISTAI